MGATTAIEFSSVFQVYNMTNSPARVDFHVFKLFLSLASPFFETLFDLPQPSEAANADMEIKDGLPVIPVSDGSKTLDLLLRFYYPAL
ncbi:hypothetical protein PISMIDRAFT_17780 [Pisolithus microcarpus 441]|uniref:Unplaced genomic scaffold scaffold_293, whole genome shotgun sequence n=1 Tax=Pisolithus microcarpus 441 TaxID=765257 RepID=A0A0C9Z190_9AGAM|nr:hypothetical protein BKA83DRAFT_17780 [Pisolithus microcarpus]KIK13733.1 hypothetical protein PISMIDRAFT_17780 [Pisolithus microcarpus 441]